MYVPRLCSGTVKVFVGAFRALGIDARPLPEGNARTRELAAAHLTGDECYPQAITLGNFLKLAEEPGFDPARTAIFMPSASGPCRFGQYAHLFRRTMDNMGMEEVQIVSPVFDDGYRGLQQSGHDLFRYVWWAITVGDILRKALHRTRPYELEPGATERVYDESLERCCNALADTSTAGSTKFKALKAELEQCSVLFHAVKVDRTEARPLIGVVGEIFCRLNDFSNEDLTKRIENHGGEVWVSDITEWILYGYTWEREEMRSFGGKWSRNYLTSILTEKVIKGDLHKLEGIFHELLAGREEPASVQVVLDNAAPYLDPHAGLGEMTLNIGKAIYLHQKGVAGIVDISPFSCMNGIVSEAIYPTMSKALDNIPIKVFYFDGTQSTLDDDVEIFMELAMSYTRKKGAASKRTA